MNRKGFSLVQAMLAMTVISASSLGVANLMVGGTRIQKRTRLLHEVESMVESSRYILSDSGVCEQSGLKGQKGQVGTPLVLNNPTTKPPETLFQVGAPVGGAEDWIVDKFEFETLGPAITTLEGRTKRLGSIVLHLRYEQNQQKRVIERKIKTAVVYEPDNQTIEKCGNVYEKVEGKVDGGDPVLLSSPVKITRSFTKVPIVIDVKQTTGLGGNFPERTKEIFFSVVSRETRNRGTYAPAVNVRTPPQTEWTKVADGTVEGRAETGYDFNTFWWPLKDGKMEIKIGDRYSSGVVEVKALAVR